MRREISCRNSKRNNGRRNAGLHIFFSAIFIILSLSASSQFTVRGKLNDEKGSPLSFANVLLLKSSDSSLIQTAVSDSTGTYTLTPASSGSYFLRFTAIGYLQQQSPAFQLSENKELGATVLKADSKSLANVTVTAMRPTITQLPDRLVVGVEGTVMAAGSTAFAVLSKAPGVFIDQDGNIQLNGRSGVTVMLDGKLTYLSARDLRILLESMPAENIKNIELITNPSAKYDAAGTSGIVNINLKKNTQQGINGSVYAGYMTNFKQHAFSGGENINYKAGKWNSFLNLDLSNRVGGREATFTRVFHSPQATTYFDQDATSNYEVKGNRNLRLGTDYSLNNQHSIGFMFNYVTNSVEEEFITNTYIGAAPKTPNQYISASNYNRNSYTNYTSNLHYSGQLDTVGTTLAADFFYVDISNRGSANFYNYFTDIQTSSKTQDLLYTSTPNGYSIYSGKIDLTVPFRKGPKIETGVKASRVISDNDFQFFFNNSGLVLDPQRTNHFKYAENILAAYVTASTTLAKNLSLQAGLRAEQTSSTGQSFTTGQVTTRSYLDFFPSVFLQQKVTEKYGINYSYSRRLTRPNYGNLNPFRAYRDPYTWIEGNPYLRPQYTHSFSLAQMFNKIYSLTLSYQLNEDVITEVPKPDAATATTVYTTGNVDKGQSLAATAIVPIKLAKWWDTQNTIQGYYNKYTAFLDNLPITNDQMTFLFQSQSTLLLPLDFKMELTFLYRSPVASGLYHMDAITRVDGGIKKSFYKKKFDLSLNVSDIFKSQRLLWAANYNGNINEFDQYLRFRVLNLSLRYNFSSGQKVNTRKNNNLEELNRVN